MPTNKKKKKKQNKRAPVIKGLLTVDALKKHAGKPAEPFLPGFDGTAATSATRFTPMLVESGSLPRRLRYAWNRSMNVLDMVCMSWTKFVEVLCCLGFDKQVHSWAPVVMALRMLPAEPSGQLISARRALILDSFIRAAGPLNDARTALHRASFDIRSLLAPGVNVRAFLVDIIGSDRKSLVRLWNSADDAVNNPSFCPCGPDLSAALDKLQSNPNIKSVIVRHGDAFMAFQRTYQLLKVFSRRSDLCIEMAERAFYLAFTVRCQEGKAAMAMLTWASFVTLKLNDDQQQHLFPGIAGFTDLPLVSFCLDAFGVMSRIIITCRFSTLADDRIVSSLMSYLLLDALFVVPPAILAKALLGLKTFVGNINCAPDLVACFEHPRFQAILATLETHKDAAVLPFHMHLPPPQPAVDYREYTSTVADLLWNFTPCPREKFNAGTTSTFAAKSQQHAVFFVFHDAARHVLAELTGRTVLDLQAAKRAPAPQHASKATPEEIAPYVSRCIRAFDNMRSASNAPKSVLEKFMHLLQQLDVAAEHALASPVTQEKTTCNVSRQLAVLYVEMDSLDAEAAECMWSRIAAITDQLEIGEMETRAFHAMLSAGTTKNGQVRRSRLPVAFLFLSACAWHFLDTPRAQDEVRDFGNMAKVFCRFSLPTGDPLTDVICTVVPVVEAFSCTRKSDDRVLLADVAVCSFQAWVGAVLKCFFPPTLQGFDSAQALQKAVVAQAEKALCWLGHMDCDHVATAMKLGEDVVLRACKVIEEMGGLSSIDDEVAQVQSAPQYALSVQQIGAQLLQIVDDALAKCGDRIIMITPHEEDLASAFRLAQTPDGPFGKCTLWSLVEALLQTDGSSKALRLFQTSAPPDDALVDNLRAIESHMGVMPSDESRLKKLSANMCKGNRAVQHVTLAAVACCGMFALFCGRWGINYICKPVDVVVGTKRKTTLQQPKPQTDGPILELDSENEEEEDVLGPSHAQMVRSRLLDAVSALLRAVGSTNVETWLCKAMSDRHACAAHPGSTELSAKLVVWAWVCSGARVVFPIVASYTTTAPPLWHTIMPLLSGFFRLRTSNNMRRGAKAADKKAIETEARFARVVHQLCLHNCAGCRKKCFLRCMNPCPGCHTAMYCGNWCQQAHWGLGHKEKCAVLAALNKQKKRV